MVRSTRSIRDVLSVLTAAVLLAGIVTAVAEAGAGSTSHRLRATSSATAPSGSEPSLPAATQQPRPTTAVGGSSGGPSPRVRVATTPTTRLATTPPPSPDALPAVAGAAGDPGQPTATAPGTYRYAVSSSGGQQGSSSGTMTEKVTDEASAAGVTRQSVSQSRSTSPPQQSEGPGGGNGTETVQWDAGGLSMLAAQMDANGQSIDCTWSPPVLELPTGLAVGRHWTFASTCHVTFFGQPATIQINGGATATGQQVVRVATDQVPVWVVSDAFTIVVHADRMGMTYTVHHDATDRFSGRLGLLVEEDATDTVGSSTMVSHQELQSIHPA